VRAATRSATDTVPFVNALTRCMNFTGTPSDAIWLTRPSDTPRWAASALLRPRSDSSHMPSFAMGVSLGATKAKGQVFPKVNLGRLDSPMDKLAQFRRQRLEALIKTAF